MLKLLYAGLTGRYKPVGDIAHADCVASDAFGYRIEPELGQSNLEIAKFIAANPILRALPKFLRFEVARAYEQVDHDYCHTVVAVGKPGDNTRDIVLKIINEMWDRGFDRPAIVDHSHHVSRIAACFKHEGYDPIVPPGLDAIPWDPQSVQPWTRSPLRWAKREILTVPYFKVKEWV